MELTALGVIIQQELNTLAERYPVQVDASVVMPNHVHLLVCINAQERSAARAAPTDLGKIVGGLKSRVSTHWLKICKNQHKRMGNLWQRSYHDHIIRDKPDYEKICNYIHTNPQRWQKDCFYTQFNKEEVP